MRTSPQRVANDRQHFLEASLSLMCMTGAMARCYGKYMGKDRQVDSRSVVSAAKSSTSLEGSALAFGIRARSHSLRSTVRITFIAWLSRLRTTCSLRQGAKCHGLDSCIGRHHDQVALPGKHGQHQQPRDRMKRIDRLADACRCAALASASSGFAIRRRRPPKWRLIDKEAGLLQQRLSRRTPGSHRSNLAFLGRHISAGRLVPGGEMAPSRSWRLGTDNLA